MSSPSAPRPQPTVVVIPCFNEARRLQVGAYRAFLDRREDVTLLFVDDGSSDDTSLVLERLRQKYPRQICTLRLGENVGKAEAVRRGILVALRRRPEFVGFWDADLATPLETVLQFRTFLDARRELNLVMGSRVALLGRQIHRSSWRHFLGRVFATAASITLRLTVYDTQCGAKLFRASPEVVALFAQPFRTRWIFDVELLARLKLNSRSVEQSILECPLERWQDVAGSRLKTKDFLVAAFDLAVIYWRYSRHRPKSTTVMWNRYEQSHSQLERRDAA